VSKHRLRGAGTQAASITAGRTARAIAGFGMVTVLSVGTASVVTADPADDTNSADRTDAADPVKDVDTSPLPEDADGLLERLGEVSRKAQATSDEVEENRAALDETRARLDRVNRNVERHSAEADRAREAVEQSREPVTELSQSMYRGAVIDPVTAVAGASNPQDAIDRKAFASALNADRTNKVADLQANLQEASDQESRAQRAKATADFQLSQLTRKEKQLDERNGALDDLKGQISEAVDGLSPEEKQRWVDRNGPIDVDVEEFLGKLGEAGDAGDTADSPDSAEASTAGGAVGAAMSKMGAPYAWGATGPDSFDCSGLMFWAYQQIGKSIPRTSAAQVSGGTSVSQDELQPGDIVGFYPGVTHVGMYIGDGQVVHASDYGIPVQVVSVDSMPFAGAARY
jgi:cell wall-associated NlpC family hydrolase